MGLPWKLLILVVIVIAVLCQLEVTQNKWVVSKSITLKASIEDTYSFITSLDYVDKWFPFVSRVRDADGRPLSVGKKLYAVYDIPAYGEYQMLYRVTEYKKGKLIVIEGNNILLPRIEFSFVKVKEVLCKMTISISFRRLSYFFQTLNGNSSITFYGTYKRPIKHILALGEWHAFKTKGKTLSAVGENISSL